MVVFCSFITLANKVIKVATSYRSMSVKFSDIIQQYSGVGDFSEWIRKVEMVASLQGVKELEKFIPLFLCGGAFAVYEQEELLEELLLYI